jgi:hypothetical protein
MGNTTKTRGQFDAFIQEQSIPSLIDVQDPYGGRKITTYWITTAITLQTRFVCF